MPSEATAASPVVLPVEHISNEQLIRRKAKSLIGAACHLANHKAPNDFAVKNAIFSFIKVCKFSKFREILSKN